MIARAGSGWQTVLADLSLILFMVMAGAVDKAPSAAAASPPNLPALAQPIAVWRQASGSASLNDWLAATPDPRLRLTIMAPPELAGDALALSERSRRAARVLIEPGAVGVSAALTYDQPMALAQGLQQVPAKETSQ